MALFDRFRRRAAARPHALPPDREPRSGNEAIDATSVRDIVRIEQTSDAEFFVGDLFRRRFRNDPPVDPLHFVAFYRRTRSDYLPVGYVHYVELEGSYLCGGLVIDDRCYRRMPEPHRKLIRDSGGIAELLLRESLAKLTHAPAIFGYVGDKQAKAVDLRAGFQRTEHPYVMVVWNRALPEAEKAAWLAKVIAVGPF